jgi:transcriptional regulator with PAS, ATPase and Fis domain
LKRRPNKALGKFVAECGGILDALYNGLVVVLRTGVIVYANDAAARLLNCSSEELLDSGGQELMRSDRQHLEEVFDTKLPRFLDERSLIRIGGATPYVMDTRIVAGTNKNLAQEVETNRFR